MLYVKETDGKRHQFFLIDGHTHIGREEVIEFGQKNYRTNQPNQILDFFTRLQFNLLRDMKKNPGSFHFHPDDPFVRPAAFIGGISNEISKDRYAGYLIDQFVTFPFNDVKAQETNPQFQIPNDMILKRQQMPPFFTRMLGFVRVNPLDGAPAIKEVRRCAEQGARGLKLHPISQHWVDNVTDPRVCEVVTAALNARLPVIFDCRFLKTAEDIFQLHKIIQKDVKNPNYGLILAHSGMEFNSPSLYQVLSEKHIFGDTSGMRSDDVGLFFKKFAEAAPQSWSEHIVFGTDYNYFTLPQATDLLEYLLSEDLFTKTHLTPLDIQRVLAGNLMSILPSFDMFPSGDLTTDFSPSQSLGLLDARLFSVNDQLSTTAAELIGKYCGEKLKKHEISIVSYDPFANFNFGFVDPNSFYARLVKKTDNTAPILLCLALPFDETFGITSKEVLSDSSVQNQGETGECVPNGLISSDVQGGSDSTTDVKDTTLSPATPGSLKNDDDLNPPSQILPERFTYLVALFQCNTALSLLNLRVRDAHNPIFGFLRDIIKREVPVVHTKDAIEGLLKSFLL